MELQVNMVHKSLKLIVMLRVSSVFIIEGNERPGKEWCSFKSCRVSWFMDTFPKGAEIYNKNNLYLCCCDDMPFINERKKLTLNLVYIDRKIKYI